MVGIVGMAGVVGAEAHPDISNANAISPQPPAVRQCLPSCLVCIDPQRGTMSPSQAPSLRSELSAAQAPPPPEGMAIETRCKSL